MKALTLWQPWAWLICAGHKTIENRPRPTKVRGLVLIHAGKSCARAAATHGVEVPWDELDYGAIIGYTTILDCVRTAGLPLMDAGNPWYEPGRWHYLLGESGFVAKPFPHRGQLGFWTPKDLPLSIAMLAEKGLT